MSGNNKTFGIGLGNAIGGIAGGLFGLIGQGRRMRQQHQNQLQLMNQQYANQRQLNLQGHQLQMDMWNKTNYPAQMAMLKEAGLNPALMYGMSGGGGTTTGSQGGGSASGGQAGMLDIGASLQAAKLGAEIRNIEANTDLTKKKGLTEEQLKFKTEAETKVKDATADQLIQLTKNLVIEGEKLGLDRDFLRDTLEDRKTKVKEELNLLSSQTDFNLNKVQAIWKELKLKGEEIGIKAFEANLKAKYPPLQNVMGKNWDKAVDKLYDYFKIESTIDEIENKMKENEDKQRNYSDPHGYKN